MSWIPRAPKLPKSNDQRNVYNTGYLSGTNPVLASPGMANSVASTADLEMYRKRRAAMIQRGEDPDAAAKAIDAKHQARKDALKRLFGMKNKSSKGGDAQLLGDGTEVHVGAGKKKGEPTSGYTDSASRN